MPISAERPLEDRLSVRDDGRLALDLSDTKVLDLSPLAGAPLAVLNLSGSKVRSELTDLGPMRGLELIDLNISNTGVAVLTEMPTLELLLLPSQYHTLPEEDYQAIGSLRNLPKLRQLGTEYFGGMGYSLGGEPARLPDYLALGTASQQIWHNVDESHHESENNKSNDKRRVDFEFEYRPGHGGLLQTVTAK